MYSRIETTDTLMAEFQIPADYYTQRELPVLANAWLQAYVDNQGTYFILVNNKDASMSRILRATTDALDASSFFHTSVQGLGYSSEHQTSEAARMMRRFLGRKNWEQE